MPHKMEAFTLLRECLSQCKIVHLMRTVPPSQIEDFLVEYDNILRKALQDLIGSTLEDKWWSIARLSSKHGGVGLKSGATVFGAQHLMSLVACTEGIQKFCQTWNLNAVATASTKKWLQRRLNHTIDVQLVIRSINAGEGFGGDGKLSLAQWCEDVAKSRVRSQMSNDELLHIMSNCGPGNGWIRATPLKWKNWEMTSRAWAVAIRRRLFLRVSPRRGMCIACKKDRIDIKGEHQVTCSGRGGLIMRHDSIKELLKQQIENCGYVVELEKNAGSDDRSKPGDLKVLRWREGRDLYIDVSVINAKMSCWKNHLADHGAGGAAAACEQKKIRWYEGKIDERTSEFLPFILEVQGGVGKLAIKFMMN